MNPSNDRKKNVWDPTSNHYYELAGNLINAGRSMYHNGQYEKFRAIYTAFPETICYMRTYDGFDDFVYLIYSEHEAMQGLYKIGKSKDALSRIRSLQTGSPFRLKISFVTNFFEEKVFHEWLAPFRGEGEWFNIPERHDIIRDSFEKYLLTQANLPEYELLSFVNKLKLLSHYHGAKCQARSGGVCPKPYY